MPAKPDRLFQFGAGFSIQEDSMKLAIALFSLALLSSVTFAQQQYPTDSKTGRAIGAKETTPEQLRARIDKESNTLIVDVRDPEEFEKETIKGAVNIPLDQLSDKLKTIPHETTLVFTCNTGRRSSQAVKIAEDAGFKTASFCPLHDWKEKGNPTEAGKKKS
jgi:rhodanese-related sulfurtransferase